MSTIKMLIANANRSRLEAIKAIENAIRYGETVDLTDLQVVSSRPQSLGFSDNDLGFYAGHYKNRQGKAMGFVQKMNVKASRNGGHWNSDERKKRDEAYQRARFAGSVLKILEDEIARREGLRLQAERDRLVRVEAQRAFEATKPAPVVETPAPAPKPVKRKSKSTFRPAQKRTEFRKSVTSFEDLAKLVKPAKVERARKAEVLGVIGQDALTELVKQCKESGQDAESNGVIVRKQGATVNYFRRAA